MSKRSLWRSLGSTCLALALGCAKDREVLGGTAGTGAGDDGGGAEGGGEAGGSGANESGGSSDSADSGGSTTAATGATGAESSGEGGSEGGLRFDVPDDDSDGGPDEGGSGPCDPGDMDCMCTIPAHVPCDAAATDPFQAMGLNCAGELQVAGTQTGAATAIGILSGFGPTATFAPREGQTYTVLGTGLISDLPKETPDSDGEFDHDDPTYCDAVLSATGQTLPAPLDPKRAGPVDCTQDPTLVGMGDCSNSLQEQWDQGVAGGNCTINGMPCPGTSPGNVAFDYTELRFTVKVPVDVISLGFDFAFFSTEFPYYYGSQYNDIFIAWLESSTWTGNISFDTMGNPISLNASFLDFQDRDGDLPELGGTCMRYHAGTNWLTTTVGVTPGDEITVVFAIFDLSDPNLDSYVLLDNFRWGCDPKSGPETVPVG